MEVAVPSYTYGTAEVACSPVSLEDLRKLWVKAVALQAALWSYPYANPGGF